MARTTSPGSVENAGSYGMLRCVTSSLMPTVKWLMSASKTPLPMAGGDFLRRRAVAPADDARAHAGVLVQRVDDVEVQRLAARARVLGAIEHRDLLDGRRQRGDEALAVEGAIKAHLEDADLFAQRIHGLVRGLAAGAHEDDDALGVRRAVGLERRVLA